MRSTPCSQVTMGSRPQSSTSSSITTSNTVSAKAARTSDPATAEPHARQVNHDTRKYFQSAQHASRTRGEGPNSLPNRVEAKPRDSIRLDSPDQQPSSSLLKPTWRHEV